MRILVTGTSGQLGGPIAAGLYADGHEVVGLQRSVPSEDQPYPISRLDLLDMDKGAAEALFSEPPDVVVHMGALVGKACEDRPDVAFAVNSIATDRLAAMAARRGVGLFVFASSAAVYSQREQSPTKEISPYKLGQPPTHYGRSKQLAEIALERVVQESSGMQAVSLRIANPCGGVRTSWPDQLLASTPDEPVTLPGWDNYYRDFVHRDDVVDAARRVVTAHQQGSLAQYSVYNIAGGVSRSLKDTVGELSQLTPVYYTPGDATSYSWADITKAQTELGFNPDPRLRLS